MLANKLLKRTCLQRLRRFRHAASKLVLRLTPEHQAPCSRSPRLCSSTRHRGVSSVARLRRGVVSRADALQFVRSPAPRRPLMLALRRLRNPVDPQRPTNLETADMDKRDIAIEHLRVAVRAYMDDGDHFAASVLGHTAGDISTAFSRATARRLALTSSLPVPTIQRKMFGDEPTDAAVRRLDRTPRNSAKHMNVTAPGDWSDRMYPHNAKQAAFDAIDLALENLYRLNRIESFDVPDCASRWDRGATRSTVVERAAPPLLAEVLTVV